MYVKLNFHKNIKQTTKQFDAFLMPSQKLHKRLISTFNLDRRVLFFSLSVFSLSPH